MRRQRDAISSIRAYTALIGLTAVGTKEFVLRRVDEEIRALERLDASSLIRETDEPVEEDDVGFDDIAAPFEVLNVLPAPSPITGDRTFFVYTLTQPADSVEVQLYSASGRLVRRLRDLPFAAGVQEAYWDVRDSHGLYVANGVLFYRLTARQGDAVQRVVGRLAVTR